jgi:hypothetical protein
VFDRGPDEVESVLQQRKLDLFRAGLVRRHASSKRSRSVQKHDVATQGGAAQPTPD